MDIGNIISVLKAISPAATSTPVTGPGLGVMLEIATQACEAVESNRVNDQEHVKLAKDIAGYASAVSNAIQSDSRFSPGSDIVSDEIREGIIKEIDELTTIFREAAEVIEARHEQELRYKTWRKGDDENKIKELREKIEGKVKLFQIGVDILSLDAFSRIENDMKATASAYTTELRGRDIRQAEEGQQDLLHQERETAEGKLAIEVMDARQANESWQEKIRREYEIMEKKLAPVYTARFDRDEIPQSCLPKTHEKLLEQIHSWASDVSPSSANVFCLTGLAGTGKTAIAQSIYNHYDCKRPTASFSIPQSSADHRSPEKILHTIVYQLGTQQEAVRSGISDALQNGQDVTTRPLAEQVSILFNILLESLDESALPMLIVIDAFNECDKVADREGGSLIPLIVAGIRQLSGRVKVLITSCEEPEIMKTFNQLGINTTSSLIQSQNIETMVVQDDIEAYFTHHLRRIAERAGFHDAISWPPKVDLDSLIGQTGKLFVYAALVVRILSNIQVDPIKGLNEIIHPSANLVKTSTFGQLDGLYLAVLNKAVALDEDSTDDEVLRRVCSVIASLVLLQTPLSACALAGLLGEDILLIRGDIDHLSAVLIIPDSAEGPIVIFHPSFSDFITKRCLDPRFRVDFELYHTFLARCCLAVMEKWLKRDMCDTRGSYLMNDDIVDLAAKRNQFLPPELQYACEYWPVHVSTASSSDTALLDDLNTFCKNHILHWIEALSLLGKLSAAQTGLLTVIRWCKEHPLSYNLAATSILEDAERVVQVFDVPIRAAALQTYQAALVFMPECSLYELVKDESLGDVRLISRRLGGWSPLRRSLEGHTDGVMSVAFSPDGAWIVSGSSDMTVRVWETITGITHVQLKGHSSWINSVAFSPDGTRVISGSSDTTVRVWDAITGDVIAQLEGHTDDVNTVAFSPEGTRIASASFDNGIRIWDISTNTELFQLEGHIGSVNSVTFSHDGTRIASGSSDRTARVWDAITGRELARFEGHTDRVSSVAFSPQGTQVVSGSFDKTVRLWDAITGNLLIQLSEHAEVVSSVAFSPDGTCIASNSDERTICLWDATTGKISAKIQVPESPGFVNSVAFSSDGTRIVSGSSIGAVHVWDITVSNSSPQLEGHTDCVYHVAFSSDEMRIASASDDKTVIVWDAVNGSVLIRFKGHADSVRSVAFSPDGTRIASGSSDTTVLIWGVATADVCAKLEGHKKSVISVAFSPDGSRIASGSKDMSVRVWEVSTGHVLAQLNGHDSWVWMAVFSEDGTQITSKDLSHNERVWYAGQDFPATRSETGPILQSPGSTQGFPTLILNESGWLATSDTSKSDPRYICWIPPERRGDLWAFKSIGFIATETGQVTILSTSHQY